MTIQDYRTYFRTQLAALYAQEEVASISSIAMQFVLKMNRVEVALSRKQKLTPAQKLDLENLLKRLLQEEPIQYIVGATQFYGLDLQVNRATLIPRPETEELVLWILEASINSSSETKVLDIGTGSGAIAIALAKNKPLFQVEAVDISLQALETASSNAASNQVNISFYQQDILAATDLQQSYDLIVSNPPYVRELEKTEIKGNVLNYEPHRALFVKDTDPLVFYKKITTLALSHLKPGGQLFFEINEYLGEETQSLIRGIGFDEVELRKDILGKDRMIRATLQ